MADSDLTREAKRISRAVSRVPAKKRREFAAKAKDFDLEAAYKTVQELIERCQLVGDVKAENTATALLLKLLGYLTDRIQIDSGPDIRKAEMEAAALRAPIRDKFLSLPAPVEGDPEGVFS